MAHHPSRDKLLAFFRGELGEDELAVVERHLAECPTCCDAATNQDTDDPFIRRLRTAVRAGPSTDTIPKVSDATAPHLPTIPGYEVVREVGRGGMGVVYEARQCSLNRTVAIKLLRDGAAADPEGVSRFRAEILAIARLDHPNVVQVFESGTAGGNPFVALEYVAGGTLADHSRGVPLPPAEAARLVAEIVRGVQAVHDAGIVHRDLKPSNVLLGPPTRVPKISDFGIAKLLDRSTDATATGLTPGTPKYMAPEQASNQAVGPATDVYAIGVILYELLTGRTPLAGATTVETLEMVRTQEPLPPRWLNRMISADLDTICMKCLQKEPAARYATAAALGDDLQRFLDGRPILARPIGPVGRAIRWCRRNRREAALVGLVVALVAALGVGGILTGLIFSRHATEQKQLADTADTARHAAEVEQIRARVEAERATQVTKFLTGLFEPHDELFVGSACLGFRNLKDATNVGDVLKLGVAKLNGPDGFADRPLVRAELLFKIGTAFIGLWKPQEAAPMLEEAVRLRRAQLPPTHPDLGAAVLAYAQVRSLLDDEVSEDLFREAIAICKANDDPNGLKLVDAETSYAILRLYLNGSDDEAVRQMERSYAVRSKALGETNLQTATTLLALIVLKVQEDQFAEAGKLLVRLTAALESTSANPELLATLRQMTATLSTYVLFGRPAAVEPGRKLVAQFAQVFGPNHSLTVHAKSTLADLVPAAEGAALYRQCRASVEAWGASSLYLRAKFTFDIARATAETAETAEAEVEAEFRTAIALFRQLAKKKAQGRLEYPHALQRLARMLAARRDAKYDAEIGALLDEGANYCRANERVVAYRRAFSLTDAGHWRLQHGDSTPCVELFATAAKLWHDDPRPVARRFYAGALALHYYALHKQGRTPEAGVVKRACEEAIRHAADDRNEQIIRAKELLAGRLPPWP